MKVDAAELAYRGREIVSRQDSSKRIAVKDLDALKRQGVVVGIGYRGPNPKNKTTHPFAAQFCEVEVNTQTGEMKILRFLAAQDSGRVMNRLTYDNQVIGGITMGIGLATTEVRILDAGQTGKMVNRNWHDYKLPTALDVPRRRHQPADRAGRHRGQQHRREGPRRTGDHPHRRRGRQCRVPRDRPAHHRHPHPPAAAGATTGGTPEGGMRHVTEL